MAKTNKVKKSATGNKKTGLRGISFKKHWKKLTFVGLAGLLVVLSFGYGAWNFYQIDKANAAGLFVKSGGICTTRSTYRGPVFSAIAPSTARSMQVYALSGSTWVTIAYWPVAVPKGTAYLIEQNSVKAYNNGGYVALKATFIMSNGAAIYDSCYGKV